MYYGMVCTRHIRPDRQTPEDQHTGMGAFVKQGNLYSRSVKPALDRVLGTIALIAAALPMLLISAVIFLDNPGPVIFRQKRIGLKKDGKLTYFEIYKFRTMRTDAPHDVPTHLFADSERYLTRVGRVLRKTSLDELPQLWNIAVKGNLSIVGPRPALWNQEDLAEEREKYGANDVMPGLTGWAQINGRDELEIAEKARLDGVYARQLLKSSFAGLRMDLVCLFRSVGATLRSDGYVEGGTGAKAGEEAR